MILPVCAHDSPTKGNMGTTPPPLSGWILTCIADYETAVRQNLVAYADAKTAVMLEKELISARGRIQQLEADIQDVRMMTKQAFVRCAGCQRLQEVSKHCRWCHR